MLIVEQYSLLLTQTTSLRLDEVDDVSDGLAWDSPGDKRAIFAMVASDCVAWNAKVRNPLCNPRSQFDVLLAWGTMVNNHYDTECRYQHVS